jgi:GT2 family glycosyltransferase
MRVLVHIHTFNDADIIDGIIDAMLRQTHPIDGILVVDNASTDGTLEQPSLKHATVLRLPDNSGTSGAVYAGIRYALDNDYDWIWVFDADSIPEPDALQKLIDLYDSWPPNLQNETAFLACLHYNVGDTEPHHGGIFTQRGIAEVRPEPGERYYLTHFTIWSGCLYRLAVVRQIGLPNAAYALDWGEGEYGYRVMAAGYKGFTDQESILHHNIRGYSSFTPIEVKLGPAKFTLYEFPPIRCYYASRNMIYFLLYEIAQRRPRLLLKTLLGIARQTTGFLMRPRSHREHILACLRGLWHGVTGNIAARY